MPATPATSCAASRDPEPIPPQKPLPFDCCESGCDRCVYEIYAEELAFHQTALAAWHARNAGHEPGVM